MEGRRFIWSVLLPLLWIQCVLGESCDSMTDASAANCWYTFWYVWVALGLFIAVVITILIVYYKQKTKRRNRVQRIAPTMAREPPPYTTPSQEPPGYEDAIKESIVVPAGFNGDIRHLRALQIRHRNEENHERQYIQRQMAANRQPSDVSIISIPPAYVEISSHPVMAHHPSQPMTAHPPVRRQITNQPQPQGLPQRPARIGPPRPAATNQQQQQPPQTQPQPSVQPSIQNNRMPERPTRLGRPQPNNQQQTTIDPITLNALQPSNPPPLTTTRTNRR